MSAIDCSHGAVVGLAPATADKIADICTFMRCKLLTIVKNWEASGQGDGGMDREDNNEDENAEARSVGNHEIDDNSNSESLRAPTFGALKHRPARALDSRAAFLGGMPSYLLYYWEVAESQQLLSSCLQRLSSRANAADASSVSVVSTRRPRQTMSSGRSSISTSGSRSSDGASGEPDTNNELAQSLQDLVQSQKDLLTDRVLDRQHQERENTRKRHFDRRSFLRDEARMYRMRIVEFSCGDDERSCRMLQFYTTELTKLEEEIQQLDAGAD
jgi:hypothetical protein